ncbi:MAG: hypothetical protein O2975_01780 [Proteobacteria bacterium]|nr:hypothetical protein [Pseudomonadota bacterium]
MNKVLRYATGTLVARYLRAAVGLTITLGLLLRARPAPGLSWIIAGTAILFLLYLGQTVVRQLTRIEIEESGIRTLGPLGVAIRWEALRAVHLGYYSTHSDRRGGWMQLEIRGTRGAIRVESTLEDFTRLATRVVREAQARGCTFDAATRENLALLGVAANGSA